MYTSSTLVTWPLPPQHLPFPVQAGAERAQVFRVDPGQCGNGRFAGPITLPLGREGNPGGGRRTRPHGALDRPLVGLLLFGHVARHQVSICRNMGGEEMA